MAGETRQVKTQAEVGERALPLIDLSRLISQVRGLTQARYFSTVLLIAILGFAAWLRLWGTNWDDGQHIHPDERFLSFVLSDIAVPGSLGAYFDSTSSTLNPYNRGHGSFVYGTFPLFATKLAGSAADQVEDAPVLGTVLSWLFDKAGGQDLNLSGYDGNLVGRFLSGLFDVGSVLLAFLVGRRLYGRGAGLLAAFLLSVTVLNIQHAHFFVVESFLTFFSLLAVFYSVRIAQEGRWQNYALAGLALGFAVASKLSALPLLGIIGLAAIIRTWPTLAAVGQDAWKRVRGASPSGATSLEESERPLAAQHYPVIGRAALGIVLAVFAAFLVFRTAQPYAFSGTHFWDLGISETFREDIRRLRERQTGTADFAPGVQWIGRTPYLFALKNMVVWGMGPALGLAAWGGVIYAGWRTLRYRESRHLLLLVWILGNFGYSAGQFVPAMRYLLPIYPQMVVLAAFALLALWNGGWRGAEALGQRLGALYRYARPALPVMARGALVATVVLTTLWALAFTSIYRRPLSRIEASEWIYDNVPAGAAIAGEHWDDFVPFNLPDGRANNRFRTFLFTPYDPDGPEKLAKMMADLDQADYIVLSSNRLYGSIPRVPARYPMTTRYYDLLFKEQLGFEIAAAFTSYPSLFGIEIPDQGAEEAFTVYDHPKVTIFKKTADSPCRCRARIGGAPGAGRGCYQRAHPAAGGSGNPAERWHLD